MANSRSQPKITLKDVVSSMLGIQRKRIYLPEKENKQNVPKTERPGLNHMGAKAGVTRKRSRYLNGGTTHK